MSSPPPSTAAQLSLRAAVTGALCGVPLAVCNLYASLKLALSFNMALVAALVGLAVWRVLAPALRRPPFGLLENNAAQTVASAAAFISSAGLTSAIPALALTTGQTLCFPVLALWLFVICAFGILLAVPMRRLLIEEEALPFATGVATATVLRELHERVGGVRRRVAALVGGGVLAGVLIVVEFLADLPRWALPFSFSVRPGGALARAGITAVPAASLTWSLPPTLFFGGVGALVGLRTCLSLAAGSVVAWALLAPAILDLGWVTPGASGGLWFSPLVGWLAWPGAALMVAAALAALAWSLPRTLAGLRARRADTADPGADRLRWWALLAALGATAVALQWLVFGVPVPLGLLALATSAGLAFVAGRVTGETAVTPAAPVGRVTQLLFGVLNPGHVATNLAAGNLTAGAASQCGDLLDDLKAGQLLGADCRQLTRAQLVGAAVGSVAGAGLFVLLFPHPETQLVTEAWPAPAATTWRTVALALRDGWAGLPPGVAEAIIIAAAVGVALTVVERLLPKAARRFCPSAPSLGLAFVLPAHAVLAMTLGALLSLSAHRLWPKAAAELTAPAASGIIAGEGLAGVAVALWRLRG